ncbi:glutamine-hydrolyzing asparagine synthase [Periconia macrospinosa]|uniref:Glutamine-hydrolyzing asparagine synthase n=1 Tax=Periconia macrospinosa TaxID=97972 RepID=A0A2V1E0K3_9PLEO|nr:glutamine-hydrolyzing asparagine synthase [Periconia macrospinosa]
MCGISVLVDLERRVDSRLAGDEAKCRMYEELDKSLDMIVHRGPDSRGIWISEDNRVALGHCRLAINDLTAHGEQPIHDADDEIHAVVNGEIYDYERLRNELSQQFGYEFKGHSDSELVVALYKHYGLSLFEQLRGEFAFCIYDSRTRLLVAGRDRYGIKPLFWAVIQGRLVLGAEAKAFLPLGWEPEWDLHGLVDDGWQFGSGTLFKGVQKVRPGHYLTCTPESGAVETREYWDITYPDKARQPAICDEEDMVMGVRDRLVDAIRLRMRADVPIGVYLSGGIDSSVVAGVVKHLREETLGPQGARLGPQLQGQGKAPPRMACFSVAFAAAKSGGTVTGTGLGTDESATAARTAQWLGADHHVLAVGEDELAASLEQAVFHAEHHNQNLNFVGKFLLSRLARAHGYRVVLTGEGADEQFAGYPMFRPDLLRGTVKAGPEPEAVAEAEAVRAADAELAQLLQLRGATACTGRLPDTLPAPRVLETLACGLSVPAKRQMQHAWHPLHAGLYAWTKSHLANSILSCLGDRTEMAHSLEARTPFLDHHLTAYVNGLPPEVKLRHCPATGSFCEKWILREAARPFVLPELYVREKHAYTAPLLHQPNGPLHRLYQRLLTRPNVDQLGFLQWDVVKHLPHQAFVLQDPRAMRSLNLCCQWIILANKFGIPPAM